MKFIIQINIALFAGGTNIVPFWSNFLYKVKYTYTLFIIEGKQYKKAKDIKISKKIVLLDNLMFLNLLKREPKISPLNKIEDWWISKEKVVIKKLIKYFFFDIKSIESIKKDIQAACLIGPIPITTM